MTNSKEVKSALKLISQQLKQTTYSEYNDKLKSQSLDKIIYHLKSKFVHHIDVVTMNYLKTQQNKKSPGTFDDNEYTPTELSKGEKERAIQNLLWFKSDIEACISHLKNN